MRAAWIAVLGVVAGLATATPAGAAPSVSQRAYAAGLDAWVYGYPPIISDLTQATFPVNTLVGVAALQDASSKLIVEPNVDTDYSVAKLDLRNGPIVVRLPALPDRYHVLELLDAYTNVFGYVGTRATGGGAGDWAITEPGWTGMLPAGVHRISSPTPDVLVLGRTLVRSPDDLPAVKQILGTYGIAPLATIAGGGMFTPSVVLDSQPVRAKPVLPSGLAFLDALGARLTADPPPTADRPLLRRLREFGIGPGLKTSVAQMPAAVRAALLRGVAAGPARVTALADARTRASERKHDGWLVPPAKTGDSGTDYDVRAVTAKLGLWANTPIEAVYPQASHDSAGRRLTGAHSYRLRFAPGHLPPARAFWSLTMYDSQLHLVANPANRYALGDRSQLARDADGSTTIYIQHAAPAGHAANWLPAPSGPFTLALRVYWPRAVALKGRWSPPPVRRVP